MRRTVSVFVVEWHNLRDLNLFIPTKIKKFRTQVSNFGLLKRYIYRTIFSKANYALYFR